MLAFAAPKNTTPPNFAEKTFAHRHKTAKFAKVFSSKVFRCTSLMIASATCTVHVRAHVIKPRAYGVHVPGTEHRKELARLRKRRQSQREREMTEKHAVSRPGCISKHQELVRQVSEGQSTMINTLHKALSCSILASCCLQVS